jgi:hypothetical protein
MKRNQPVKSSSSASIFSAVLPLCAALLAVATTGCGRPFDVKTAPGLVELDDQGPRYDYRAIAPEGVVVGVKVVDIGDKGDLAFWTRATSLRMHQLDGYALLGTSGVKSRDGMEGRELRFGHDEAGKPYLYTLRIYVKKKGCLLCGGSRLFIMETGGPRDEVARYQQALDWMQASLKLD